MPELTHFCALIPAAGQGARFGAAGAKQYLPLAGRPMIYHAIATLWAHESIDRVVVVLAEDDVEWDDYGWSEFASKLQILRCGGATRAHTVLNALDTLDKDLDAGDWLLVHDAARPCLDGGDLAAMIETLASDEVGGILAVPLADTLKRGDEENRIDATVPRAALWRAQTPQMFRYGLLRDALRQHIFDQPTDEASVIERCGLRPRLIPGSARNIKVTFPADLAIAELFIRDRKA